MAINDIQLGQLANTAKEMIGEIRHTTEHNAPNYALVAKFTLQKGHDTMVIPKVGQMTVMSIASDEENTNEMDLGLTTSSVSTAIVGGKIILTDTLLADSATNIAPAAGRQWGNAFARRMETDIIALYAGLNGGTSLGAAGNPFNVENVMNVIANAKTLKMGSGLHVIHHPNALLRLSKDLTTLGSGNHRPIPVGYSADRLNDFFSGIGLSGVTFFESGEITRDTNNDAIGVIKAKDAIGIIQAGEIRHVEERDEGIGEGANVIYVTHRYAAFELDDALGAGLTYAAATPSTT